MEGQTFRSRVSRRDSQKKCIGLEVMVGHAVLSAPDREGIDEATINHDARVGRTPLFLAETTFRQSL